MYRDPVTARWMAVTFSGEGLITSVSPETEEVTGYAPGELSERSITEILADASVFRLPDMMNICRQSGTWTGQLEHLHRSGTSVRAHGVLTPLSSAAGSLPFFLLVSAFSADDSEQTKDGHLKEIGSRLREFAHQLNNPLAVILGFTQLIMTSPQCTGPMVTEMERLYSEMRRIVEIVQRLHKYAFSLQENARHEDVMPRSKVEV
jgi:PAS domain S-box-containing protein